MQLENKSVLLTGASGGIGKELAQQLASAGAQLILCGRNEGALQDLIARLPGEGHRVLVADIATLDGVAQVDSDCQKNLPVDLLINLAGCNRFALITDLCPDDIESQIQLNLLAPIRLSQRALNWSTPPQIIVNVGSTLGAIGYPGYSVYCASKAGLQRYTEALNRELDRDQTRMLYVAPRATDTALNDSRVQEMNQVLGNGCDSPQWVAGQIIEAIQQEQSERWLGWPEKLFVRINALLPALVTASIRKQHAVISQYARKYKETLS